VEILFDCDDKTVTTVLRTQTGINLHGAEVGVSTVKKMNNFDPFAKNGGQGGKSSTLVYSVVILLGILVLVLLGVLGYMMFFKNKDEAYHSPTPQGSPVVIVQVQHG